MEQIAFRDWRVVTSVEGAGILRLEIESTDGTDIIETGETGPGTSREGDQFQLHFTTQRIEDSHRQPGRSRDDDNRTVESDEDEGQSWTIDEDETIYLRGWEISALVDEDGMLNVSAQHGQDNEVYDVEPIESGVPLTSRVVVRLAAEEDNDEDEDEEDEEEDLEEEYDEFDEEDDLDLDEAYGDDIDMEGDDYDDLYDAEEDVY